jgi:hypothetical protein
MNDFGTYLALIEAEKECGQQLPKKFCGQNDHEIERQVMNNTPKKIVCPFCGNYLSEKFCPEYFESQLRKVDAQNIIDVLSQLDPENIGLDLGSSLTAEEARQFVDTVEKLFGDK